MSSSSAPTSDIRRLRGAALVTVCVLIPLGLAGCSSSSSAATPTTTVTTTETATASPTDTPSPTDSPTDTPTGSPSPTDSPTTVSPSPTGDVKGISLVVVPVSAAVNQRINLVGTTDKSLAGKLAYSIKTNDGVSKVLGSGVAIGSSGVVKSYVQLLRSGVLKLVVPVSPLAVGVFNPSTPLLATSGDVTVTIG